jgi:hypothetical protein
MSHGTTALLLVGVAVLAVTVGTGGYTTTSAERGVNVAVADDEHAMIGVEQTVATGNGTTELRVTVTNQFPSRVALSAASVRVGGRTVGLTASGTLGPGEAATATFENVTCGETIAIAAEGNGADVRLTRSVDC